MEFETDALVKVIEVWWSYALLASIIWYSLTKWIPYIVDKHNERLKEQDDVYKSSLRSISTSFTTYMDKSMGWHEKHTDKLEIVNRKVESIENKVDIIIKK